jgi:hypothetical protein
MSIIKGDSETVPCELERLTGSCVGSPIKCIVRFSQNDDLEEPAARGGG